MVEPWFFCEMGRSPITSSEIIWRFLEDESARIKSSVQLEFGKLTINEGCNYKRLEYQSDQAITPITCE